MPEFLHDLNAMHEAEETLTCAQIMEYGRMLVKLAKLNCIPGAKYNQWVSLWRMYHATAAQRAEAFLRTLNLWVD